MTTVDNLSICVEGGLSVQRFTETFVLVDVDVDGVVGNY